MVKRDGTEGYKIIDLILYSLDRVIRNIMYISGGNKAKT